MTDEYRVPGQLSFAPIEPKSGTVKAALLDMLRGWPDGICRKDAAVQLEVYELSARVLELEADGFLILRTRCTRHRHRQKFVNYRLG